MATEEEGLAAYSAIGTAIKAMAVDMKALRDSVSVLKAAAALKEQLATLTAAIESLTAILADKQGQDTPTIDWELVVTQAALRQLDVDTAAKHVTWAENHFSGWLSAWPKLNYYLTTLPDLVATAKAQVKTLNSLIAIEDTRLGPVDSTQYNQILAALSDDGSIAGNLAAIQAEAAALSGADGAGKGVSELDKIVFAIKKAEK